MKRASASVVCLAIFAGLATGSATRLANAEPAEVASLPLDLTWNAPEGCPDASSVRRRVERILEGVPLEGAPSVVAEGNVLRDPSGSFALVLTMRVADVTQTRTITATSCAALADAFAAVIALSIDPSNRVEEAPPPSAHADVPPTEAPTRVSPRPPPKPAPQVPKPPRFFAGAGAALEVGTLPQLAAGVLVTGGLRVDRVRLGVLASWWPRQHAIFDEKAGAGASFDMLEVGAFAAYMIPWRAFAFGPCAEIDGTFVRFEGFGIRAPRASWATWPSPVLGARAELLPVRWLRVFARADVVLPIAPTTFTLGSSSTATELHQPALPSARFSSGVEFLMP